jgi:dCMP deaminase
MNKVNPHKNKYFDLYMDLAIRASEQSVATKKQVGAVIILPTGLISLGWNGTPAGFDNDCEYIPTSQLGPWVHVPCRPKTKPEVIHAERNALDKLTRQGVPTEGSILFVTTAPCIECAKSVAAVGIKEVIYLDTYKNTHGVDFLRESGVEVKCLGTDNVY